MSVKVNVIDHNSDDIVSCQTIDDYSIDSVVNWLTLVDLDQNFGFTLTSTKVSDVLLYSDEDGGEVWFIAPTKSFSQQDVDTFNTNHQLRLSQDEEDETDE